MNKNLKNLLILPLCASAIALGYVISERQVDEYFHPTYETKSLEDYLSVLGPAPLYYKETTAGQFLSAGFAQRHKVIQSVLQMAFVQLQKDLRKASFSKFHLYAQPLPIKTPNGKKACKFRDF